MATRFSILYRDGTEAEGWLTPRALLAYERKYGNGNGTGKRMEGTFWAAWTELRIEEPFEEWVDSIRDFSEDASADPRQATPPGPSLPSPPSPDLTPEQQPN